MNTRRFSIEDTSVSEARQFIRQTLSGTPQDRLEMIELMVSELATNCIRHAQTGFRVTIYRNTTEVRVEVTDHAAGEPVVRSPGPADPTGRGLRIVQMLSNSWGVEQKEKLNKTVWFTLSTRPPAECPPTSTPSPQTLTSSGSKNHSETQKLDQQDPLGPEKRLDASTHARVLPRRRGQRGQEKPHMPTRSLVWPGFPTGSPWRTLATCTAACATYGYAEGCCVRSWRCPSSRY